MPGIAGMNATTGKMLDGIEHLTQSVRDIAKTRRGTRVMRREYGIDGDVIDRPGNRATLIEVYVTLIDAIERWEPRLRIKRILVTAAEPGHFTFDLDGTYLPEGRAVFLEGIQT